MKTHIKKGNERDITPSMNLFQFTLALERGWKGEEGGDIYAGEEENSDSEEHDVELSGKMFYK